MAPSVKPHLSERRLRRAGAACRPNTDQATTDGGTTDAGISSDSSASDTAPRVDAAVADSSVVADVARADADQQADDLGVVAVADATTQGDAPAGDAAAATTRDSSLAWSPTTGPFGTARCPLPRGNVSTAHNSDEKQSP